MSSLQLPLLRKSALLPIVSFVIVGVHFLGFDVVAQVRVVQAPVQANFQAAFDVTALAEGSLQASRVELLYRSATTGGFRAVVMTLAADGRYRGQVPASDVTSPGVEVYVQLTGTDAKIYTDPPGAPSSNVYFIAVVQPGSSAKPPSIKIQEPEANGIVLGRSPTIKVVLAPEASPVSPGNLVANIDGIDVTAQLEIAERTISIRPASALTPGTHQVALTFLDPQGQPLEPVTWSFAIRDFPLLREAALTTDFTWNSEYAPEKLKRDDPNWKTNANFRLMGKAAEGDFETNVDSNLRWIDQERGQIGGVRLGQMSLVNGLGSVRYQKHKFEIGDLAVNETFFTTGASFPRRGMKVSGELFGTQYDVFGVRPEPVTGFVHVNGVNDSDNRIQGASLSHSFFGEAIRLQGVVVNGRTEKVTAFNTGAFVPGTPAIPGSEGTTYGLQLAAQFLDGRLRGEAEWSLSDADLALGDDIGKQQDQARRVKITAQPFGVVLGAEYQRIGRDFISLANPTLVHDRDAVNLSAATTLGFTSWSLGYNWGRDNVRNDEDLPRVMQRGPVASFALAVPEYPAFMLTYARNVQNSQYIPVGTIPPDSVMDTLTAGISYSRPQWSAFLNTGYTLQDFSKGPQDTDNTNVSLGFAFSPSPAFSISPSYAFNRQKNRSTDVLTFTQVPTLTARLALVPNALVLDSQTSFNETKTDGSTSTSSFSELLRVSWMLTDLARGYAEPALSLRFNYNKNKAPNLAGANANEWGVFLVFDLFAKLQFLPTLGVSRASSVNMVAPFNVPVGIPVPPTSNTSKKP